MRHSFVRPSVRRTCPHGHRRSTARFCTPVRLHICGGAGEVVSVGAFVRASRADTPWSGVLCGRSERKPQIGVHAEALIKLLCCLQTLSVTRTHMGATITASSFIKECDAMLREWDPLFSTLWTLSPPRHVPCLRRDATGLLTASFSSTLRCTAHQRRLEER